MRIKHDIELAQVSPAIRQGASERDMNSMIKKVTTLIQEQLDLGGKGGDNADNYSGSSNSSRRNSVSSEAVNQIPEISAEDIIFNRDVEGKDYIGEGLFSKVYRVRC